MGERDVDARTDVYALRRRDVRDAGGRAAVHRTDRRRPSWPGADGAAAPAPHRAARCPAHIERAVLTALQKLPADRLRECEGVRGGADGRRVGGWAGGRVGANRADAQCTRPRAATPSRRRAHPRRPLRPLRPLRRVLRLPPPHATCPGRPLPVNLPGLQRNNLRYSGSSFALSRDGRRLAYVRTSRIGERSMWVLEPVRRRATAGQRHGRH